MIIKNYKELVKNSKLRKEALEILKAGLEAVKTEKVIREKIKLRKNLLHIKDCNNKIQKFNLDKYKKIIIVGFGKASAAMGRGVEKILNKKISDGLIISTQKIKLKRIKVIKGTHPIPSLKNLRATKKLVKLIKNLDKDDLIICLISGGGSALLCYPSIPFGKYLKIIKESYKSGLDIEEFNKIRKKLSRVKGGKLVKFTKANVISLIFSDVISDNLSIIASGPTVGKSFKKIHPIKSPARARVFGEGEKFNRVKNILLLNNQTALKAMYKVASSFGLKPMILTNQLNGEARIIGKDIIKKVSKIRNKDCFLFGGETTVRVHPVKSLKERISPKAKLFHRIYPVKSLKERISPKAKLFHRVKRKGKGGRNQEFCLAALEEVAKFKKAVLVSINTDGIDGPTNAAGAIIDQDSLEKSIKEKLNYKEFLKNNTSYSFFKKLDDLVFSGSAGINIADIGVVIKH